jgi:hypothetical protein
MELSCLVKGELSIAKGNAEMFTERKDKGFPLSSLPGAVAVEYASDGTIAYSTKELVVICFKTSAFGAEKETANEIILNTPNVTKLSFSPLGSYTLSFFLFLLFRYLLTWRSFVEGEKNLNAWSLDKENKSATVIAAIAKKAQAQDNWYFSNSFFCSF